MSYEPVWVFHMHEDKQRMYVGITPREAVRNAYAQDELGDYNTWTYAKYDDLVQETPTHLICGNWSVPLG
ncbi:MAG TPA: hypothetical protein VFX15_03220 [Actinomycetes bacterium]|nr:hypothetical protein [Actinomycetes bacterium]